MVEIVATKPYESAQVHQRLGMPRQGTGQGPYRRRLAPPSLATAVPGSLHHIWWCPQIPAADSGETLCNPPSLMGWVPVRGPQTMWWVPVMPVANQRTLSRDLPTFCSRALFRAARLDKVHTSCGRPLCFIDRSDSERISQRRKQFSLNRCSLNLIIMIETRVSVNTCKSSVDCHLPN